MTPELQSAISVAENAVSESWLKGELGEEALNAFRQLIENGTTEVVLTNVYLLPYNLFGRHCGLMVSALDSGSRGPGSGPGRVIVLCSWARHFTLTVPLSTQEYKWVPANCQGNLMKCW